MNADEALLHTVDEYTRMAETYDANVRPRFESIARRVVDLLDLKPGEHVLDLGAGTGNATLMIAERVRPGGLAAAIDASEGQLRVLNRRAGEARLDIHAEIMDATNLLYPRNAFHGVASNLGIPVFRWRQCFQEVYRVLLEGGRFAFSEWRGVMVWVDLCAEVQKPYLTATPSERLAELRQAVAALRESKERDALLDPAEVTLALRKAGFEEIRQEEATISPGFATVEDFLAFRLSWGYDEMEWREMGADAQAAFRRDLDRAFRERFGGVDRLHFDLFFTAARRP